MQTNTHTRELFISWRFRLVTFLMCANSFCGQKGCYCVPRWVHGQMLFTQLQRNHAKIFLPNNGFQLILAFLQEQPDRLFHIGIWLFKYLHAIKANSVSPSAPGAGKQHLNDKCTASWCEMPSAESTGERTCSSIDLAWRCITSNSRSQVPKAARKQPTKQKVQASVPLWLSLVTWPFTEQKAYSLQKKTRAGKQSRW